MQNSQSQRVLWLLEELEVEYNLVNHTRDPKTRRAPPSLQSVHPLGKAPIFVTADGKIIVESAAIIGYIIRTYDKTGKHASNDVVREETLSAFSGSSLHLWVTMMLTFDLITRNTPWPFSYATKGLESSLKKRMFDAELAKSLEFLSTELGDNEWFNGAALGRPDILLNYPIEQIIQRGYVDVDKDYPKIGAWRSRIVNSPSWKRGLEKGNGFDLLNV